MQRIYRNHLFENPIYGFITASNMHTTLVCIVFFLSWYSFGLFWCGIYIHSLPICFTGSGAPSHYSDVTMTTMVSRIQPHGWLLNRLFRRRSKKTSKLRVTGLCAGNSPVTGAFPAQRASDTENNSIWWRHKNMVAPVMQKGMYKTSSYVTSTHITKSEQLS